MTGRGDSIGDVGEFGLIERLAARVTPARTDTVVGAGDDDTAVLRLPDGRLQLATLDTLVENVHFVRTDIAPRELGARLAAVNLSDIAAMGGAPTHALASLVAPDALPADFALDVVDGLVGALRAWGADLVGGNLASGDLLVLDLALLGEVDPDRLLLRSTARPGDAVIVTGALGAAAAARAWRNRSPDLAARGPVPEAAVTEAMRRWRAPDPRLRVAPLLRRLGATAAIDVSDGLAADLGHVCDRSGVGVLLEADAIPIDPAAVDIADALGADALAWALGGGEDYELLCTARPDAASNLCSRVAAAAGVAVTVIGRVTEDRACQLVGTDGTVSELAGGWRHFARGATA